MVLIGIVTEKDANTNVQTVPELVSECKNGRLNRDLSPIDKKVGKDPSLDSAALYSDCEDGNCFLRTFHPKCLTEV